MKPEIKRIVAWHPVLTDHQAYTYHELSRLSGLPVVVQVASLEDETRRAQGWTDTRVTSIERQLIPARDFLSHALRYLIKNREQIHIFGSAFESLRMTLLLWVATLLRLNCYIISEPYSPIPYGYFNDKSAFAERLKVFFRPKLYRFYMLALRRGLKGIFTISSLAAQQYENAGMPSDRLFPFGYFVPSENVTDFGATDHAENVQLRMVFIGSLIARKGLPTLINAVQKALSKGVSLQLDVYGPGDISTYDFGATSIRYMGCIPFGGAQQVLKAYNLLVLPSYYDGWGVVVNEALCAGVPVLCSDQVGARALVETFNAGQVFPSGDVEALAVILVGLANDPARLENMRLASIAAAKSIQPTSAAAYMLQVMLAESDVRSDIVSPWYRDS
jgi:glycosyltransferase involved in cell wall biosynthesis